MFYMYLDMFMYVYIVRLIVLQTVYPNFHFLLIGDKT